MTRVQPVGLCSGREEGARPVQWVSFACAQSCEGPAAAVWGLDNSFGGGGAHWVWTQNCVRISCSWGVVQYSRLCLSRECAFIGARPWRGRADAGMASAEARA